MIINESNCNYFDTTTTGMDKYDDILNHPDYYKLVKNITFKIRWMHPSEYISRCARDIFNVSYDRLFNNRNDYKIDKYSKEMKSGEKFDMPILNYSEHTQEGLHRAISAMRLNDEDYIPVMVLYNNLPLHRFVPNKNISK